MSDVKLDPLAWIAEHLNSLDERNLRRRLHARTGRQSVTVESDGKRLINFGSNDYLGLAGDERIAAAVKSAVEQHGWGAGASPLITGYSELHERLEQHLAQLESAESALLFTSGYAANVGTLTSLVGKEDAIFSDEQNHASIVDGCRLSRAQIFVYPHRDVERLRQMLAAATGFRRRLIVTDTVFSMEGDTAPLHELTGLAERFDAMLMVDEAHATGVFGHSGAGWTEVCSLEEAIHIRVGTLSKGLGSIGGFVVGPSSLRELLLNTARSYIFSTALPAAACAAGLAALDIVQAEPWLSENLLAYAAHLRASLQELGYDTGGSQSQVIPIIIGDAGRTMELSAALRQRGYLVPGIRPPSVAAGRSLLRISVTAAHTEEMIEELVTSLRDLRA
jgi:8-amino-7-oxononanoate synthase